MRNLPLNYEQVERLRLQKQDHRRVLTMLRDGLYCCLCFLFHSILYTTILARNRQATTKYQSFTSLLSIISISLSPFIGKYFYICSLFPCMYLYIVTFY